MKLSTIHEIAPLLYRNGVKHNTSIHLEGPPGCGKSESVEDSIPAKICADLGYERDKFLVLTRMLNTIEAPDLGGFRVPTKNSDGKMITAVTMPDIMAEIYESGVERGILFLDERGQAPLDVQKACAPTVLDQRMGNYRLPPGWVVWSASNRMKDNAGTVRPPMHLINREMRISVEIDHNSWVSWAANAGVHPLFIAFIKFKPSAFMDTVPTEPEPYCTPRSFVNWFHIVNEYTGGNIEEAIADDKLVLEFAMGLIGKGIAAEAVGFMRVAGQLPTYDELLADPVGTAKKIPADRMDVLHASTSMLAFNIKPTDVKAAFQFINHLPKEFRVATVHECLQRTGGALLNTKEFAEFAKDHRSLVLGSV